jgi:dCMP deaminase
VVYDSDKYADTVSVYASKKMLKSAGVLLRRYEHTGREISFSV